MDPQGRVLLPAPVRRQLGLEKGDELLLEIDDDGRVALATAELAWRRAQSLFDGVSRDSSVVDELLAERRAEAARETQDPDGPDLDGR